MTDALNANGNPIPPGSGSGAPPLDNGSEGSAYSRLQRERDEARKNERNAKAEASRLRTHLDELENVEELERRAETAKRQMFDAEAKVARANLIEKEFPQLRGKENFLPLGTIEEMRTHAKSMVDSFGLSAAPGSGPESFASPASPTFASTLQRLEQLPPKQLADELKKLPTEVLQKLEGEFKARGWL